MAYWMSSCRRMQIDSYLPPCTQFKSKIIRLQHKYSDTETHSREIGKQPSMHVTGDHFLTITQVAQTLRATINKWNLLKLRSFYKAKNTVNETKRQPTEWEKIFTKPTSDRGLVSKIHKELKKTRHQNTK